MDALIIFMFIAVSYEFDDADVPGDPEFKPSNHFLIYLLIQILLLIRAPLWGRPIEIIA